MSFFLFNYRRCPFCIRVRLVFLFKGVPFEFNEENLRDRSSRLKELHGDNRPSVPVLLHDDKPVFESLDIMKYVNDLFPEPALSEKDFRYWGDWSAKEFRDAIQLYKYSKVERDVGLQRVQGCFDFLEGKLSPNLNGSDLSLADFAVWPFVRQALRVTPVDVKMGPKLEKWFKGIEEHPKLKGVMDKK